MSARYFFIFASLLAMFSEAVCTLVRTEPINELQVRTRHAYVIVPILDMVRVSLNILVLSFSCNHYLPLNRASFLKCAAFSRMQIQVDYASTDPSRCVRHPPESA